MKINSTVQNIINVQIVHKVITKNDLIRLQESIDLMSRTYNTVNLIVLINKLKGITLAANIEAIRLAVKEKNTLGKVAIVSDNQLYKVGAKIDDFLTPWKEKYFSTSQLEKAWEWLQTSGKVIKV
jgi:hypothetical protein